jgi:hypothetical protein
MRVHRGVRRPKEEALLAALGLGVGIVAIVVIVLIVLAVLWFARRT